MKDFSSPMLKARYFLCSEIKRLSSDLTARYILVMKSFNMCYFNVIGCYLVLYGSLFPPLDETFLIIRQLSLSHNKLLWDPNPELWDINSKLQDKLWTVRFKIWIARNNSTLWNTLNHGISTLELQVMNWSVRYKQKKHWIVRFKLQIAI